MRRASPPALASLLSFPHETAGQPTSVTRTGSIPERERTLRRIFDPHKRQYIGQTEMRSLRPSPPTPLSPPTSGEYKYHRDARGR
eukprot:scaffold4496_cov128-Isochrysis_galbana.AAC.11